MNIQNRQARASRRAKTRNLVRQGVPFNPSKFGYMSDWKEPGYTGRPVTVNVWQSFRKLARRPELFDASAYLYPENA